MIDGVGHMLWSYLESGLQETYTFWLAPYQISGVSDRRGAGKMAQNGVCHTFVHHKHLHRPCSSVSVLLSLIFFLGQRVGTYRIDGHAPPLVSICK